MTIEAIKKVIAALRAHIREINGTLECLSYRHDEDAMELLAEERDECRLQLYHYKKMLKEMANVDSRNSEKEESK